MRELLFNNYRTYPEIDLWRANCVITTLNHNRRRPLLNQITKGFSYMANCRSFVLTLFFSTIFFSSTLNAADLTWASKAVIKLFATQQSWSVAQPWSKNRSKQSTCSGFFIKQGILTNAHCVADATYIEMEIPDLADKVEVRTVAINHQVDLALLKIVDNDIGLEADVIEFGELPELRDKVVTVGYPMGGRQVSYTEGVVSRIDVMRYIHSNILAPLVQTDATINLGNSGGPVFSDKTGDCLGVATQKLSAAEGMGFFIPTPIIKQFLNDLEDGTIAGIPSLGATFQTLENPAARDQLNLTEKQSGIRVRDFSVGSTFDGVLQADDVILEVEGHTVLNDGRVRFRESGRIWLGYYVAKKQVGDTLKLKISRAGEVIELDVELKPYRLTIVPRQPLYDQQTPYYVSGGMLFLAVEQRYLWGWGRNWKAKIPTSLKSQIGTLYGKKELEQLVVISEVFDASVNKGYSGEIENIRVVKVNDLDITKLADVEKAMTENRNKFHIIELEGDVKIVLNRKDADEQNEMIRARYGID